MHGRNQSRSQSASTATASNGVHSGPVSGMIDVNGHANLAGAGLNIAQRVMVYGDAGHILVSKHVADDLGEYENWRPLLHDLGECEVKHETRVSIVNLHADEVGNPQLPKKFQALKKHRVRMRWAIAAAALLALAAIIVFTVIRHYHFNPKDSAEIDRHVREESCPFFKRQRGLCATIGVTLTGFIAAIQKRFRCLLLSFATRKISVTCHAVIHGTP
jgi:hypothetical protein